MLPFGQNRKVEIDISAEKLPLYGKGWLDLNLITNKITWRLLELISELKSKIRIACDNRFQLQWQREPAGELSLELNAEGWTVSSPYQQKADEGEIQKKRDIFFEKWGGEETVHLIAMRVDNGQPIAHIRV